MNEKNLIIIFGMICFMLLIGLAVYTTWNHFQLIEVLNDTNTYLPPFYVSDLNTSDGYYLLMRVEATS